MALKKIIEMQGEAFVQTPFGTIKNGSTTISFLAYIKVLSVIANKNEIIANVTFSDDNTSFTKQYEIAASVVENSKNFIAQAYEHLKTLPEFAGAIDC
jgi:hypothetical protein